MYSRLDDLLDEAIIVSEKSIHVLLLTSFFSAIGSLLFNSPHIFFYPPLITSSYFLVALAYRIYKIYLDRRERKTGLLLLIPSYTTIITTFLGFAGILTTFSYLVIFIGFSAIITVKILESRRDFLVIA